MTFLVTTDQNMRYQQNLIGRRLAIVVLLSTAWPYVRLHTEDMYLITERGSEMLTENCPRDLVVPV